MLRLVLVTDDRLLGERNLLDVCNAAVRGGVTSVQLRLKAASPRDLAEAARILLGGLPVPVLVNDRADVALAVGAAGVHLGPDDTPVALVRRMAPPGFIIGASVGTPGEVENGLGADYWGVGPLRSTRTKDGAGAPLGSDGFRRMVRLAEGKPCVAIGGVAPQDVPQVLAGGGVGVAVVSGLLEPRGTEDAARRFVAGVEQEAGDEG